MVPRLITLEEHFISSAIPDTLKTYGANFNDALISKLQGLGDERLGDMDDGAVDVQVVSHGPFVAKPEQCRQGNNELAQACQRYPERLAGFAMLPMGEPEAAASELERTVRDFGFVGALINNHENGTFYDEEKYWVVFEKAVELDVPIYIHPSFPTEAMAEHYKGNYGDGVAFGLSIAGWGWHSDTGLHILRLFAAGLFEKLPKLKLIIGHDGEMLPFMLDRVLKLSHTWGTRQRDLQTVWQENIWVTTSAMFSEPPLACLLRVSKIDHIMYSVDYPFAANAAGLAFVKQLQQSDLISDEDLEKICHGNAERLLKLKPRAPMQ